MKIEQKIVGIYTILGLISGFIANHLHTTFGSIITLAISFAIYFISLPPFLIFVKKKNVLLYNSSITFFLCWLTVWVLLYNLGV
ncbi:MAG: hypothetical protein QW040_01445 [Candidatus Aenigmatarchaeota archaeon]